MIEIEKRREKEEEEEDEEKRKEKTSKKRRGKKEKSHFWFSVWLVFSGRQPLKMVWYLPKNTQGASFHW